MKQTKNSEEQYYMGINDTNEEIDKMTEKQLDKYYKSLSICVECNTKIIGGECEKCPTPEYPIYKEFNMKFIENTKEELIGEASQLSKCIKALPKNGHYDEIINKLENNLYNIKKIIKEFNNV